MFENLSDRLERSFKILKGEGQITEINVAETLKDVRRALLDADVNYKVAKTFADNVKKKAMGMNVLTAVKPGQLMIKLVHDELAELMGGDTSELNNKVQEFIDSKGAPNGLASLNESGIIPSAQLPSYVDDVIEVDMGTISENDEENYYATWKYKDAYYQLSGQIEKDEIIIAIKTSSIVHWQHINFYGTYDFTSYSKRVYNLIAIDKEKEFAQPSGL